MTDFTKLDPADWPKVRTRDGRRVRMLCTDGPGEWPVAGYVDDCRLPLAWAPDGKYSYTDHTADLILPPEPRTVWLRVWDDGPNPAQVIKQISACRFGSNDPVRDYRITLCEGQPPRIEEVK